MGEIHALKRARFGIKSYLCKSKSEYVWNVLIHTVKGTNVHCLTVDNFYNSLDLADNIDRKKDRYLWNSLMNRRDLPQNLNQRN